MAAASRLGKLIEELIVTLDSIGATYALIGGLALASHNVIRATQDVDLLSRAADSDAIDRAFKAKGFRCLHRNGDVANYLRGDERVDFLFASREIAKRLLIDAPARETSFGLLRVVSAEGLIGFKLQAIVNDPRRTQDLEDIRALLRTNRDSLNLNEVRDYFRLFGRDALLEELLDGPA